MHYWEICYSKQAGTNSSSDFGGKLGSSLDGSHIVGVVGSDGTGSDTVEICNKGPGGRKPGCIAPRSYSSRNGVYNSKRWSVNIVPRLCILCESFTIDTFMDLVVFCSCHFSSMFSTH